MRRAGILALVVLAAGCGEGPPEPQPVETDIPENLRSAAAPNRSASADAGSPMAERVATIGLLNKRNNVSQDFELKPGETRRAGDVILRLSACERTAPWELPRETGAFVQVLVRDTGEEGEWRKVFSGWLFKNSPSLNVVEHPIYDVWVKDCTMSFPGDEAPDSSASEDQASTSE